MKELDHTEIKLSLGENIRNRRKLLNLTQEALSFILGVENRSLSELERGKTFLSLNMLTGLCKALKTSPSELFRIDKNTENIDKNARIKELANILQNSTDSDVNIVFDLVCSLIKNKNS